MNKLLTSCIHYNIQFKMLTKQLIKIAHIQSGVYIVQTESRRDLSSVLMLSSSRREVMFTNRYPEGSRPNFDR